MRSINLRSRCAVAPIAALGAVAWLLALPLGAAASTYPAGGSGFGADAEGWQVSEASCNIPLAGACTASGGHDSGAGNPPGSLAAKATVTANFGGLFESTVVFESPDFVASEDGPASIQLDRQLEPGGLVALVPEASYTVSLVDRDSETPVQTLAETLDEGDAFFASAGAAGVVSVTAGHTYALIAKASIGSTAAGIGVLGDAVVRFDNITLSVEAAADGPGTGSAGGSGGGSAGSGPLSSSQLFALVRRSSSETAEVRGKRVFVRVSCPHRVRRACRITAQGMIRRRVRVTRRGTVRVASGRTKLVVLEVKPRFRDRVAARKRLLIVQEVRAGKVSRPSPAPGC